MVTRGSRSRCWEAVGEARAATQFWALQNVTLADGGTVTGSFGYDYVSGQR